MSRPDVIILGGPTASGKTSLAIALAEEIGGEIVGADSRQIYAGMSIGTAAPSASDRARIPHHLVEFLEPHVRYSAAQYVRDASAAIDEVITRGRRPIVVGGTGFYLRALCGDVALATEPDRAIRERVEREAHMHPLDVLHAWLTALDPRRAAQIEPGDAYRIVRALEIARSPDSTPKVLAILPTLRERSRSFVKLALTAPLDVLHARIGTRTDAMLAAGFIEEAERIGTAAVAADAVGYRDALGYLAGHMTASDLRMLLARSTRRYAKRQFTWFRAEPELNWLDATREPLVNALRAIARTQASTIHD